MWVQKGYSHQMQNENVKQMANQGLFTPSKYSVILVSLKYYYIFLLKFCISFNYNIFHCIVFYKFLFKFYVYYLKLNQMKMRNLSLATT